MKRPRHSLVARSWSAIADFLKDARRELRRINSLGQPSPNAPVSRRAREIAVRRVLKRLYDHPSGCC